MVRMADRLAENFIPEHSRNDSEQMYKARNSRVNSRASVASSFGKKLTYIETDSGVLEVHSDKTGILDVIKDANMDGVHHLEAKNPLTSNPVATNIEAEYPSKIAFPTVAICNNNQFRLVSTWSDSQSSPSGGGKLPERLRPVLTYITGGRVMNRRAKPISGALKSIGHDSASVFDMVMRKAWDLDAVKFLRSAAHWKSRMILGCTWPNGTSCKLSDFKAVWTTTGLCWAINTDAQNPFEVTGSGSGHGLRLLLNVESYERVDACTKHFKTKSLPGLKILIYNQTDVPESSEDGVNVPSGYSMDIPFKMQHRHKLPGVHCIQETPEHKLAENDFDSPNNIRSCTIRKYMAEIEGACQCTMRRAFTPNNSVDLPACNVDDYYGCVQPAIRRVREEGTASSCLPPCSSIDYTAWQDMNRLPQNLMPTLIVEQDQDDEDEVEQDDIEEEAFLASHNRDEETFSCEDSAYLDEKQVMLIKRGAHRAYEKQSRYQEDIFLRSRRLITRLRNAIDAMNKLHWGWHAKDFVGVYERLSKNVSCFANFSARHEDFVAIVNSHTFISEEKKTSQIYFLLDEEGHKKNATKYKSIGDLKSRFGDRVEEVVEEIQLVLRMMDKTWRLFTESSYQKSLTGDFSRMDRIVELMEQYEMNKLQRRAWAEKMMSRQMRHFFDEDFYDAFYQPLMKDLDQSLVKVIEEVEEDWKSLQVYIQRGTAAKTGATLFFGDASREMRRKFAELVLETHKCVSGQLRRESQRLLSSFKKAYRELQSAYGKLFKEELPDYLENFQFGHKFVSDNFAMVNIYLHKMNLERWSQDRTYGFWSLACDIGGALGLFLGISLLTIFELIYLCIQYGLCGKRARKLTCFPLNSLRFGHQTSDFCSSCFRGGSGEQRKKSQSFQKRFPYDYDERHDQRTPSDEIYNKLNKRAIWNQPKISDTASMSPSEVNDFLEQVRRNSHPPRYDQPSPVSTRTMSGEERPRELSANLLSPKAPDDRLTDIIEEDSRRSSDDGVRGRRRPSEGLLPRSSPSSSSQTSAVPRRSSEARTTPTPLSSKLPPPRVNESVHTNLEPEPVSVSEISESTTPALFHVVKHLMSFIVFSSSPHNSSSGFFIFGIYEEIVIRDALLLFHC
ncbi:unnamed protein product [Caenorhabditis auriculariae]|uniref:Uncharacterized protein n=1 Tax=Caenorhabditis auriculariae TaxID=2777116 RepID=A0A8S1HFI7_9PELO|nr:unnamed protein product [Caenorhabditis auriculariae]